MSAFGKVIAIFFIFLLCIVAVVAIMAIAGKTVSTPFVDSYNGTTTNISNATQDLVNANVQTGSKIGTAAIYIVGFLMVIVVISGAVIYITR